MVVHPPLCILLNNTRTTRIYLVWNIIVMQTVPGSRGGATTKLRLTPRLPLSPCGSIISSVVEPVKNVAPGQAVSMKPVICFGKLWPVFTRRPVYYYIELNTPHRSMFNCYMIDVMEWKMLSRCRIYLDLASASVCSKRPALIARAPLRG